jgi:hypothetical protein
MTRVLKSRFFGGGPITAAVRRLKRATIDGVSSMSFNVYVHTGAILKCV